MIWVRWFVSLHSSFPSTVPHFWAIIKINLLGNDLLAAHHKQPWPQWVGLTQKKSGKWRDPSKFQQALEKSLKELFWPEKNPEQTHRQWAPEIQISSCCSVTSFPSKTLEPLKKKMFLFGKQNCRGQKAAPSTPRVLLKQILRTFGFWYVKAAAPGICRVHFPFNFWF